MTTPAGVKGRVKAADHVALLRKVPLLAKISERELRLLASVSRIQEVPKEALVFEEGDVGNALYAVVSGMVKIYRTSSGGRVKALAFLEHGDFFGEMAIIDREIRSASARALEVSRILVLRRQDFGRILEGNPRIAFRVMQTLCARLRNADVQIDMLSFQGVLGRVANTLLELAQKHGVKTARGTRIDSEFTHEDLAEMVGSAREMVTKILNRFKRANAIALEGRHISITDEAQLRAWIL